MLGRAVAIIAVVSFRPPPTSNVLKARARTPIHTLCPRGLVSQPLLAGFAHFDALAPLGHEGLVGADAPAGVRVEDAVDDVAAAGLATQQRQHGIKQV